MRRLIIDTPNILFRVFAAQSKYGDASERAGLSLHVAINTLQKYHKLFKPDQIAVVFEGSNNWRKAHTKSNQSVSKRVYKANRVKDPSMEPLFELVNNFHELIRHHTSLVCLHHEILEGDDLIAGYAQRFHKEDEVIILSGDKDFMQLLRYPNVRLINPDNGQDRTVKDPHFFMFEKCFRGDGGDNVMTALPRVRTARLQKAFNDNYELTQLLNETWVGTVPETGEEITYKVADLYTENELLMDLIRQPEHVRQAIDETLDHELQNHGKFSYRHFLQFLGKFELEQIAKNAQAYVDLFSTTGRTSPHQVVINAADPIHQVRKRSALNF